MTNPTRQISYLFVSGICIITHNIVIIIADAAGFSLVEAVLTSFVIVVLLGYMLHSWITFREPLSGSSLQRYALAMSVNVVASFAVIWAWKNAFGLPMAVAAPLASASMLGANYLLSRWAIVIRTKFAE